MQHPTNEDDGDDDESDWESDETMELATDEASDDGSEADEESDDGSAADEAAKLKQEQIDWYEQALRNISDIALPIIRDKDWDRLVEIDGVWNPPGLSSFGWKGSHPLYQMYVAWVESEGTVVPTEEQIADLLDSLTRLQLEFAKKFADLQKNQNYVLLP